MYEELKDKYRNIFGDGDIHIFYAPGRTELGGNHTDHQHGEVIASAVDKATVAAVSLRKDMTVDLLSEGFARWQVDIGDLEKRDDEEGTTQALIRGVAAWFADHGFAVRGFDAYVSSEVLSGSGLSSSAAFEVLIGNIFNWITGAGLSPEKIAMIGQFAENVYFGKPSGLMDQMASSVGSVVHIDFGKEEPVITKLELDLGKAGYVMCIIDSGADHADLTDDYAAIPNELAGVSACFGKKYLRDVDENEFWEKIAAVRDACGDRAVMRAMHVFSENKRVEEEKKAIESGNVSRFLELVRESGLSSWRFLQNIDTYKEPRHQEVAFALGLAEKLLGGRGAVRVHGGGFAGTIQAFVPKDDADRFVFEMERVLGKGTCSIMQVGCPGAGIIE